MHAHRLSPSPFIPPSPHRRSGWLGPNTPLDLQGIDYSTSSYDSIHKAAPGIPSMSSETSSAVSDRGEYANNAETGHVSSYDNQYPGCVVPMLAEKKRRGQACACEQLACANAT
jgi:hypothetical protein